MIVNMTIIKMVYFPEKDCETSNLKILLKFIIKQIKKFTILVKVVIIKDYTIDLRENIS